MKPICAICLHCFMILLFFPSISFSASAETETLYYDWNSPDFILSSNASELSEVGFAVGNGKLSISFEGQLSSGVVASRSVITGEIILAASDTIEGNREPVQFTLTLEKNGKSIGSTTVTVQEGGSLDYATYSVSFSTTDSFKSSDELEWSVDAFAGANEQRGMQLDTDHSYLVLPLYEFPWPMFMGAFGSQSSFQP